MSIATFDERVPLVSLLNVVTADGTSGKTLHTGPSSGARIDDILICNDDTIAHVVKLYMTVGAVSCKVASLSVPAGTGVAGVPPVQVSATNNPTVQAGWLLPSGAVIGVQLEVAMGAGKTLEVAAFGGDY